MRRTSCFYLLVASVLVLLHGSRSDHPIHGYTENLPDELVEGAGKRPCDYLVTNGTLQLYADDSKSAKAENTLHFDIMNEGYDISYNIDSPVQPLTVCVESSCVKRKFADVKRDGGLVRQNVRQVRANNRDGNTKRVTGMPARNRNTRRITTDNIRLNTDTRRQNTDNRRLETDTRRQNTDNRRIETDTRRLNTDNRRIETDTRRLNTYNRRLETDTRRQNTDNRRIETDTRRLNTYNRRLETDTRRLNIDNRRLETDTRQINTDNRRLETDTRRINTDKRRIYTDNRRINTDIKHLNTDNRCTNADNRCLNTDNRRDSVRVSVRRGVDSERVVRLRSRFHNTRREADVRSVGLNDDTERFERQEGMNVRSTERQQRITENNRRRETDDTRARNQITLQRVRDDGRLTRDRRIEKTRTVRGSEERQGRESRSAREQNERSERSRTGNTRHLEHNESSYQESNSRNDISATERTSRERHELKQTETHRRHTENYLLKQRDYIREEGLRESRRDISRVTTTERSVRDTRSLERNQRRITDQRRSMPADPENVRRNSRESNRDNVRETNRRDNKNRQADNRLETLVSVRSERRLSERRRNTRSPDIEVRDDKQRRPVRETRFQISDEKLEAARRDIRNEDSIRSRRDIRINAERNTLTRDFERLGSRAFTLVLKDRQRTITEPRQSAYNQRRIDKQSNRDISKEKRLERRDLGRSVGYQRKTGHDSNRRHPTRSKGEEKQDVRRQVTHISTLSKVKTEVPQGYVMTSVVWFKSLVSDVIDSMDVGMVSRAALLGTVGYMGQNLWQKSV